MSDFHAQTFVHSDTCSSLSVYTEEGENKMFIRSTNSLWKKKIIMHEFLFRGIHSSSCTMPCCEKVVLEGWWDLLLCLVIPRESVDSSLDENNTELGVFVLAVDSQVFVDSSLIDQMSDRFM
jgi:hypothetical protein